MTPRRFVGGSLAVLVASAVVFVAVSLDHLSVFPAVGEDEPWIAAAPYKLATQGVYGSDLFAGYYGVDRHNYQHPPLFPLLQAGLFKAVGIGVVQMRLLPVVFGLALIAVIFLVGSRIGDFRVGALAVVLVMALRVAPGGDSTGILLLDRARINRYDIAVPVFAFLAFLAFLRADRTRRLSWFFATGLLTGLASLSHLFGAFWLPLFLVLSATLQRPSQAGAWARGDGREPPRLLAGLAVLTGFGLPWLPWLAYIASGWTDFVGQFRFVATRFDVLNPSFYVSNALHGPGPISVDWFLSAIHGLPLTRAGAWIAIIGVPLAGLMMAGMARGDDDRRRAAGLLAQCAFIQLVMFLALLNVKTVNYMIGLWPFVPLMLAWLGVWLWDTQRLGMQVVVLVLLALVVGEGTLRMAHAAAAARRATSYDRYTRLVARCIPEGSRVLGLQHYWLGLRQFDYRTWLVPANYSMSRYYHAPMPMDAAIEEVNPDVILIDRVMRRFFEAASQPDHPSHAQRQGFDAFMASRPAQLVCTIQDATYGTMDVYRVNRSLPGPETLRF